MEEELRCFTCKQFYINPVLLPCYHGLCLHCALNLQQPANHNNVATAVTGENAESVASGSSGDYQESDKLSILSETDSGVVCTSRPNSYVGSPNGSLFPGALSLTCPICQKVVYFDDNGAHNLPKYRVMQSVVERYGELKNLTLKCQMCEQEPAKDATVMCEQCEVLYCESCRESCHPSRGPLAKHVLNEPKRGGTGTGKPRDGKCPEHSDEPLNMYCLVCKIGVCALCLTDSRHASHDVQSLAVMCKAQKTELSHNLQQLSERARSTTEFIQRLKGMSDKVNENCEEFEQIVTAQCEALILAIQARRDQLIECIRQDKELRVRALKEQVVTCTSRLQQTTALLQFCIEALKETDSSAFLQVGSMLISRVANTDNSWHKEWSAPRVSPHFDLTLDDKSVLKAIEQLNFIQMKPYVDGEERVPAAPAAPAIIPEECSAENNSVTVAWQPPPHSHVEGYVLELDDGNGGDFREVYCGIETICTVDGLHFHCMYNARVKAFNSSGEGEYSELIGLQTAEVAWFTFDPILSGPGLQYSQDNTTVTGEGWEHRVSLGSVGFSRGIHYWEFTIDKYDADTDPAFGIARIDVTRDKMLGKDDKGWAMYIDRQRSWFQHGGAHEQRVEGGIHIGSTIGVLLDLDQHVLQFYVNEEPQGLVAFRDLYGVFYPAVSLNRGVSVTLHTALDPPSDTDET
ncbi:E3 ubiquitin-protein ligase TRIM9 isoform X1 [Cylas formicarius]|uniref:E3 ubiquitin-protein ligase TRIM9 isoform X1 n=1 Tax=Cylas formicarius TaxID=197179 RepID=UPI0029586BD7|nr:E3 ubiquitin-protein ligase TRIM9 isoform X1 [Cylas formicarius]